MSTLLNSISFMYDCGLIIDVWGGWTEWCTEDGCCIAQPVCLLSLWDHSLTLYLQWSVTNICFQQRFLTLPTFLVRFKKFLLNFDYFTLDLFLLRGKGSCFFFSDLFHIRSLRFLGIRRVVLFCLVSRFFTGKWSFVMLKHMVCNIITHSKMQFFFSKPLHWFRLLLGIISIFFLKRRIFFAQKKIIFINFMY